nr:hypothetical protein [Listeria innocua]
MADTEYIGYGLLVLVILVGFLLLMFGKGQGKELPTNLILITLLLLVLPSAFSIFSSFSTNLNRDIQAGNQGKTLGEQVIERNVDDIYLLASNDWAWEVTSIVNVPDLPADTLVNPRLDINPKYIQVTDILDADKVPHGEVLKYRINESAQATEKESSLKVFGKIIPMFDNRYYRYRVHWLPLLSELIIFIIAMTISAFKFSLIIWKMMGDYMLLAVGGYADVLGLSRVKALVQEILGSLALIVYMPLLFQIFTISQEIIRSSNFTFFSWFFATLGSAYLLIDGPNGFAKIVGIDAGLKTAGQLFMGAMSALGISKIAGGISHAVAGTGKSVGGALASSAGQLGFAGAGMAVEGMSQGIAALAEKRKGKGHSEDKDLSSSDNEAKETADKHNSIADLVNPENEHDNLDLDTQNNPESNPSGQINQEGLSQDIETEPVESDIAPSQAETSDAPEFEESHASDLPLSQQGEDAENVALSPISDDLNNLMDSAPPEMPDNGIADNQEKSTLTSPMEAQERQGKTQAVGNQTEEKAPLDDKQAPTFDGNPLGKYLKERATIRVMGHDLDDFRNTKGQQNRRKMVEAFRKGREAVRYEQEFHQVTAQGRASIQGESNFRTISNENQNPYQYKETRQAKQARENLTRK